MPYYIQSQIVMIVPQSRNNMFTFTEKCRWY